MNVDDYFKEKKGLGILATADGEGRVNAAVYGRPHFIDGETVAFIMGPTVPPEPPVQPECGLPVQGGGGKIRGEAPLSHQNRRGKRQPAHRGAEAP